MPSTPAKVKFILGRAGSGKTRTVYEALAENERRGKRSFLIVPDRATFQTERELSVFLGGGMLYTSVLSFTRLARRTLDAVGDRSVYLSAQGRRMLIRRVLGESAAQLEAFKRVSERPGFAAECDHIVLNCKRYSIAPEELAGAEGLPEQLGAKLRDFALIYGRLNERMKDCYIDGEDLINSLIDLIPQAGFSNTSFFIDAPDMMNAQSIRIVEALFTSAESVALTFRDACGGTDGRLFEPDRLSFRRLNEAASALGCEVKTVRLGANRRHSSASLAALEANLFAYPYRKFAGDARNIELHSSSGRQSELREAADRILAAVKSGLRFRDIAVVVSDLSAYAGVLRRCFAAYGIPFFMDAGRSVSQHPIAELMLCALRCAENNFRAEDFIRVLKSGFTPVSDEAAEKLENHILKFALSGSRLYSAEPSVKNHNDIEDFEEIESARLSAAAPILALKEALTIARSASAKASSLYAFLDSLCVAARLKADFERMSAEPAELLYALEERQIYDTIVELLDQIHLILGDEPIGVSRFISVVEEGLAQYEINVIPTTLDQVIVGEASSLHLPTVKLLLVLGANEGRLPAVRDDNSVINDRDLMHMKQAGLTAWETSESMNRTANLNLYSVISKATEALYLSYCTKLDSGPAAPALLVSRIGELFPHCLRTSGLLGGGVCAADEAAFGDLVTGLRRFIDTGREGAELKPLYAHFAANEPYSEALSRLEPLFFGSNSPSPLGQDAALRLYGSRITGTPTRLETFNRCPFCYFMQFGLGLRERELREERSVDHGSLIHDALDQLFKLLTERKPSLAALSRDDVAALMDEYLPALFERHNYGILLDSALMRAEAERLREELYGIGWVIIRQIVSGQFRPYASELSFGLKEGDLPALELEGANGVRFRMVGVVDRVDKLQTDEGDYFRIIDYKTGEGDFDFAELANGLRLQLPLYAAAVQAALGAEKRLRAAALYYMKVCEAGPATGNAEEDEKALRSSMRLSGPMLSDERIITASDGTVVRSSLVVKNLSYVKKDACYKGKFLVNSSEMERTIGFAKRVGSQTLDAIMQGRAEVSPSKTGSYVACKYCPYLSICRFDTTSGSKYRRIRAVTADQFYNRKDS